MLFTRETTKTTVYSKPRVKLETKTKEKFHKDTNWVTARSPFFSQSQKTIFLALIVLAFGWVCVFFFKNIFSIQTSDVGYLQ